MKPLWILSLFFIFHEAACDAVCTVPGRFPNNTRDDCRGYVMCLKAASSITHYDFVCPENFIYSHIDKKCTNVSSYQCFSNHTCIQEGNYSNYINNNRDSYIACIRDLNKIISARIVKCPEDMSFSPTDRVCVNSSSYKCIQEAPKLQELFESSSSETPQLVVDIEDIDDTPENICNGVMNINSGPLFILLLSVIVY